MTWRRTLLTPQGLQLTTAHSFHAIMSPRAIYCRLSGLPPSTISRVKRPKWLSSRLSEATISESAGSSELRTESTSCSVERSMACILLATRRPQLTYLCGTRSSSCSKLAATSANSLSSAVHAIQRRHRPSATQTILFALHPKPAALYCAIGNCFVGMPA